MKSRTIVLAGLLCFSISSFAGAPAVRDPGISEKAIRQSQPNYTPKPEEEPDLIESPAPEVVEETGPAFFIKHISVEGNSLLPDETIAALVDIGDGREFTLGQLKQIVNRITAAYAEAGYILVRAYLPPQDITEGRVTIKILQGQIDELSVSGNNHFSSEAIVASLDGITDDPGLSDALLERSLLNLNDVYGLTVQAVMKPGATTGTTDMVVNIEEGRPYLVSFDADNFGSDFTGENRYGVTGLYSGLFHLGDEISFRGITTNGDQNYINAGYKIPVIDLNTFMEASYVYSDQQLGANLTPLQAEGDSNIGTLSLSHYWQRSRTHEIKFNGGTNVRLYKNELLGADSSDDQIIDLFISANGFFSDRFRARTYYDVRLQKGLTETDEGDLLNSRLNGRGNAWIAAVDLTRYQGLGFLDSYLVLRVAGQLADRRLLAPDLYAAGGMGTVRGYPLAEIAGDNAVLLSAEYSLPVPVRKILIEGLPPVNEMLSLFGFIDHSTVFANQRLPGEVDQSITGAGFGARVNIVPNNTQLPEISFMAAYAKPVLGSQTPSDRDKNILYLGGLITY